MISPRSLFLFPVLFAPLWADGVRVSVVDRPPTDARAADITAALQLELGMTVADIGAGTGLFLARFAQAVGSEGKVYAVDIAPRLVEFMRQRADSETLTQVEVVRCTKRSASLPENSVDVVFVCDTYPRV